VKGSFTRGGEGGDWGKSLHRINVKRRGNYYYEGEERGGKEENIGVQIYEASFLRVNNWVRGCGKGRGS